MQTQAIRAKFNQGVFEPLEKVSLPEGFDVMIHLEELDSVPDDPSIKKKHSFELLSQLNFKSEVKDGSTNLDKYIYDNLS